MNKYCGLIGYADLMEVREDVYKEVITERKHYGDFYTNSRNLVNNSDSTNDNIAVSNQISIVMDPYISANFHKIRYATYLKSKWKVTSAKVEYPRIILTLGGLYNENKT